MTWTAVYVGFVYLVWAYNTYLLTIKDIGRVEGILLLRENPDIECCSVLNLINCAQLTPHTPPDHCPPPLPLPAPPVWAWYLLTIEDISRVERLLFLLENPDIECCSVSNLIVCVQLTPGRIQMVFVLRV